MDNEKSILIKEEQTNEMCPEPTTMFLDEPLGVYWSTDHINEDSRPNLGWDENENNNAVVNTLLHTIREAESECCPPPLLVPKKELFPDDALGISCLTDFIKEDPELNLEADETENIFLEDPLKIDESNLQVKQELELKVHTDVSQKKSVEYPLDISWTTDFIKEEPALNLEAEDYANIVVASRCYASNSTSLVQSNERCDFPFEETIRQGVSHSELKIASGESTNITMFHDDGEDEEEEGNNLSAPRLKCSLRKNKYDIFSCSFCLQSFSSKYRLINHVFDHIKGVQPPKCVCKSCGEVFPGYVSLKKHLTISRANLYSSAGKKEVFDCSGERGSIFLTDYQEDSGMEHTEMQCEIWKSFPDKAKTLITAHNPDIRDRNDSNRTSDTTGKVNAHTVPNLGNRSLKCDVCGKSFTKLVQRKRHALIHTRKSLHKCDICCKSFSNLGYLKTHLLIHTGTFPHKCDVCGKSFTHLGTLKRHALIHTGMRPHKCDNCGKTFTQLSSLNTHALVHTGSRPHKCVICGKSFMTRTCVKKHALIHTDRIPHQCDICGKSYIRLVHLKRHALIHTGSVSYKCDICGKSFTRLSSLKNHALIHTGMKPYNCDICGKSFTRRSSLNVHALIHTGTKPYKCDICGRSFRHSGHRNIHALIHTGLRPHKCAICGKSFMTTIYLKKHALIHTGSKHHKCDTCGKSFTHMRNLKKPMLIHIRTLPQ